MANARCAALHRAGPEFSFAQFAAECMADQLWNRKMVEIAERSPGGGGCYNSTKR